MIVNMPLRATGPSSVNILEQMRQGYFDRDIQNRNANIARANAAQQYWDQGVEDNAKIARAEDLEQANALLQMKQQRDRLAQAQQEVNRRALADKMLNQYHFAKLKADEQDRELGLIDQMHAQAEKESADKMALQNYGQALAGNYIMAKSSHEAAQRDYEDVMGQISELQAKLDDSEEMKEKPLGYASWKQRQRELTQQLDKDIRPRIRKAETALDRVFLNAQNKDFNIDEDTGLIIHIPSGSRFKLRPDTRAAAPSPVQPTLDIPGIAASASFTLPGQFTLPVIPGENYFGPVAASEPAKSNAPWYDWGIRGAVANGTAVENTGTPMPMPDSKDKLVPGGKYVTSRGVATWTGSEFVK